MKKITSFFCLLITVFTNSLIAESEQYIHQNSICEDCTGLCGTVPYPSNTGKTTPDPIINSPKVWSFVSEPHLHPMKVKVKTFKRGTSSGLIFVAPYAFSEDSMYGQSGSLILDNEGNPVWFRPLSTPNLMNSDFRMQTFDGKPVLTFWQGTLATPPVYTNVPGGSSEPGSCYYILDNHYRVIQNVAAQKGYTSDIHEFLITPNNTALLLSTKAIPMDLTPFGGPEDGFVQDFAIQEIDLHTNKLLFFWNALDHIPLEDSFEPASSASSSGNVWDAYHLNAVGLTDNQDDILFSGRNTWTIYKINKPTGNIIWQLGGKKSDFDIADDARFSWQHDARFLPDNVISMFDDNCCESADIPPGTPPARGLLLKLDFSKMKAKLHRTYFHDPNLQVASQGNVQTLDNGNKFIGWGQSQYYAEFKEAGNTVNHPSKSMVYSAKIPKNNYTYRAYRNAWVGLPHYPPSLAVRSDCEKTIVYASWNGSTETRFWQVFAGANPKCLLKIETASKNGFETDIRVSASEGPYFQVKALDAHGHVIGESEIVKLFRECASSSSSDSSCSCD